MRHFQFIIIIAAVLFMPVIAYAGAISNRLSGRILLDVERRGEAWYVYPPDQKRYYLGRADDAFVIMRNLGMGITNADLAKIAIGSDSGKVAGIKIEVESKAGEEAATSTVGVDIQSLPQEGLDISLSERLRGRILLQVEGVGEAWYVNPADKARYYLGRPEDAYQIMRELSLGITRKDLALVPKNTLNESLDEYSRYEYTDITTANGHVFKVDIITINLDDPGLEILTVTVDDETCLNDCKAKSLAEFVEDNNGFAGINGTYFCPPDYTACKGKQNSYTHPVFNTPTRTFVNAENMKYPTSGPILVFDTNNKFYYFKDTHNVFISEQNFKNIYNVEIQAAFSNKPRLIEDGLNYLIDWELDDKQMTAKAARNALAVKGRFVYLVIAYGATVPDLADVLQAMEVEYAVNLDGGGSAALYYNGVYKEGPRRDVPNAIIFKKK